MTDRNNDFGAGINWKDVVKKISIEVDPEKIEKSYQDLIDQIQKIAKGGKYTKVRIRYEGKQIGPDIPLMAFVVAEVFSGFYGGIIRTLLMNLGVRSVIDIEFIHEASEKVDAGKQFFVEGDIEQAEKLYREALELGGASPSAHFHLAVLLRMSGRKEEAISHLQKLAAMEDNEYTEKAKQLLRQLTSIAVSISDRSI